MSVRHATFIVAAICLVGKTCANVWSFGLNKTNYQTISRKSGQIAALQKVTSVSLEEPPCTAIKFVQVTVYNEMSTPKVAFDKQSLTVTISYDGLASPLSKYDVISKGIRNNDCNTGNQNGYKNSKNFMIKQLKLSGPAYGGGYPANGAHGGNGYSGGGGKGGHGGSGGYSGNGAHGNGYQGGGGYQGNGGYSGNNGHGGKGYASGGNGHGGHGGSGYPGEKSFEIDIDYDTVQNVLNGLGNAGDNGNYGTGDTGINIDEVADGTGKFPSYTIDSDEYGWGSFQFIQKKNGGGGVKGRT